MQRLKTHSQFRAVLAGQRIASTAHFVLHQCPVTDIVRHGVIQVEPRCDADTTSSLGSVVTVMGAMVPKRWAKRAVTRNMIKRQIYTLGGAVANALPCAAYVVRLRAGFDRQHFVSASSIALKQEVRQELMRLFSDANRPRSSTVRSSPLRS